MTEKNKGGRPKKENPNYDGIFFRVNSELRREWEDTRGTATVARDLLRMVTNLAKMIEGGQMTQEDYEALANDYKAFLARWKGNYPDVAAEKDEQ